MSDKTGAPKSPRGGAGVILTGLAAGVVLGAAPVAAPLLTGAAESALAAGAHAVQATASEVADIHAQFESSFVAGAVATATNVLAIICEE
jgi:hypothetical protein